MLVALLNTYPDIHKAMLLQQPHELLSHSMLVLGGKWCVQNKFAYPENIWESCFLVVMAFLPLPGAVRHLKPRLGRVGGS